MRGFSHPHYSFPLAFCLGVCQYIDMICINCFHAKTAVTNSRAHQKAASIWRRRRCERCRAVFTTYELPTLDAAPIVTKANTSDQTRHTRPFNLGKLTISIARSFHHDKTRADFSSLDLAKTVEQQLIINCPNPSTEDIAALTHQTLKAFDPIAALQYAAQHQLITTTRRPGRPATFSRTCDDQPSQPSSSQ